jgi:polyhydroxyalkanoate synthase
MGGLLALALARRRPADVAGLALLATPWDFHAEGMGGPGFLAAAGWPASQAVAALGRLPASLQHALFAGLDPLGAARRFGRLGAVAADGATARTFVALEDWANDGVPLAGPVAQECLLGWYGLNTPGRGLWRVAGRRVRPEAVRLPAFVAVPEHDRIVPPAAAAALARALPAAERHAVAAGHVSMVAGPGAPARLWAPLGAWLLRIAGAAMQK